MVLKIITIYNNVQIMVKWSQNSYFIQECGDGGLEIMNL